MNSQLVILVVSLAILSNCIAKNSEKVGDATATNQTELQKPDLHQVFAEGLTFTPPDNHSNKASRIKGRKGAILDSATETLDHENRESDTIRNTSLPIASESSNNSSVPVANVTNPIEQSTTPKPVTSSTSTTTNVPTTKKVYTKPTVTIGFDDSPAMKELVKQHLSTSKVEESTPRTSADTDRSMMSQKAETMRRYVLYGACIAFASFVTLALGSVMYKKIKNWMEIRHYQRVDFLVDGMYVS